MHHRPQQRAFLVVATLTLLALLGSLSTASTARAAEPATAQVQTPPQVTPAQQTNASHLRPLLLVADLTAIAAGTAVALTEPFGGDGQWHGRVGRGVATSMAIGTLAAPTIYWAHGYAPHGAASALVRGIGPPVGSVFGFFGSCIFFQNGRRGCARDGFAVGTAAGWVLSAAVDVLGVPMLPTRSRTGKRWYGWQTAIPDLVGLGLGTAMFVHAQNRINRGLTESEPEIPMFPLSHWLGIWLLGSLGSPIVHFVHGEFLTGLGSAAMRVFGSVFLGVGGIVGYCAAVAGEDNCTPTGFGWGIFLGALFISSFDVFVLSWEETSDRQVHLVPWGTDEGAGFALRTSF